MPIRRKAKATVNDWARRPQKRKRQSELMVKWTIRENTEEYFPLAMPFLKRNIPWNKGKTKETDDRVARWAETLRTPKLNGRGSNHWNWQGGISKKNHLLRNGHEYREWRRQVFYRDGWICVICRYRSKGRRDIRADHIKPFCKYPKLRFNVPNGRTLCIPCDRKYGWNLNRGNKYWGKNSKE